jgi:hypothetical protein
MQRPGQRFPPPRRCRAGAWTAFAIRRRGRIADQAVDIDSREPPDAELLYSFTCASSVRGSLDPDLVSTALRPAAGMSIRSLRQCARLELSDGAVPLGRAVTPDSCPRRDRVGSRCWVKRTGREPSCEPTIIGRAGRADMRRRALPARQRGALSHERGYITAAKGYNPKMLRETTVFFSRNGVAARACNSLVLPGAHPCL